ncbi:MAG: ATP-binding protein [Clostridia bacterium]|nr:ATP-binding protein [Clostridia bacterium]
MFVGREQEMQFFNSRYNSDKAEFIVLYGRRRVGKTEFLTEFCKDKPTLFYTCREYTDKKQFAEFSDAVFSYDYSLKKKTKAFADWDEAFSAIADIVSERKLVVVIDEFPHMVKGDKSIPSVLQVLWDHKFKNRNIMFILSGSSVSFMEDEILAAKNPLYGRMTAIYKMRPLPFDDAIKFFPDYSREEQVEAFAILGGIPHYLKQFDPSATLAENVKTRILTCGTVLFGEVDYILHQELREPAAYITILEAIAVGCNRFNEITERTQIESGKLSVYISNLIELGLVIKELPALSSAKDSSKKSQGEYIIADNFFRFWFACACATLIELMIEF